MPPVKPPTIQREHVYPPESIEVSESVRPKRNTSSRLIPLDLQQQVGLWIAGGGLLLLGVSPFFNWVSLGAGGVLGIQGDGKIVLAITIFAAILYVVAMVTQSSLLLMCLVIQGWGVVASFWMGSLIWRVTRMHQAADMSDNPFAGMLATLLVSPGAGLYLGIIGGVFLAGSLGFVAARRLMEQRNPLPLFASFAVSCTLGILVAFLISPIRVSQNHAAIPDTSPLPSWYDRESPSTPEAVTLEAHFGKSFALGNVEITPQSVELVTLSTRSYSGTSRPRDNESYVLTFAVRNTSEGQVFSPYSMASVVDNFGNKCDDPTDSLIGDDARIAGNEEFKDLRPGDTAIVKVACDPMIDSATEFIWTIRTKVSNQGNYEEWQIRYSP